MSLLMQALKKAEKAKGAAPAAPLPSLPASAASLTRTEPALGPSVEALEFALDPAPTLAPAPAEPVEFPSLLTLDEDWSPRMDTAPMAFDAPAPQAPATVPAPSPAQDAELTASVAADALAASAAAMALAEAEREQSRLKAAAAAEAQQQQAMQKAEALAQALQKAEQLQREQNLQAAALRAQMEMEQRAQEQAKSAMRAEEQAQQSRASSILRATRGMAKRRGRLLLICAVALVLMAAGGAYVYWATVPSPLQSGSMVAAAPGAKPVSGAPSMVAGAPSAASPAAASITIHAGMDSGASANANAAKSASKASASGKHSGVSSSAAQTPSKARPAAQAKPDAHGISFQQGAGNGGLAAILSNAYRAYISGDLDIAQQQYSAALQLDVNNRDALLGMASVASLRQQSGAAVGYYLRLLELDPNDADAVAALTSMQQSDPVHAESRLKKALADRPDAPAVLFSLGNLYAQQARWAEAQQTYFRAFGLAPANPDYAFNLAVSLDRLGKAKLAIDYYSQAQELAKARPANFSSAALTERLRQLRAAL